MKEIAFSPCGNGIIVNSGKVSNRELSQAEIRRKGAGEIATLTEDETGDTQLAPDIPYQFCPHKYGLPPGADSIILGS